MGQTQMSRMHWLVAVLILLEGACVVEALAKSSSMHSFIMSGTQGANTERLHAREQVTTRGQALRELATAALFPGVIIMGSSAASAEVSSKSDDGGQATPRKWISGRGAQPKGSDDKTGTKKESKYLRCLSNCVAECQKPTSGPERDREECLQLCQDECCTSYEQCTYPVTQNR